MRVFAPIVLSEQYLKIKKKFNENSHLFEYGKWIGLFTFFLFTLGSNAYFVNKASTQGYFLRSETKNLEKAEFGRNIAVLDTVKIEQQLWEEVVAGSNNNIVQLKENVVLVPVGTEYSFLTTNRTNQ